MAEFTYSVDLPPGIDSDSTTFSTKGRWADGSNVRFVEGKPQTRGGWTNSTTLAAGSNCRAIASLPQSGGGEIVVYGMETKLYIGTFGAAPTDRTPASLSPSSVSSHWSIHAWGSEILAAPYQGKLYHSTGSAQATEVADAPDVIASMIVSPRRQVIAFGCSDVATGNYNNKCIRWSDLENYADWSASSSDNAGEHILDDPGAIVAGKNMGPIEAVWTTHGLHTMSFVGDPGQTYYVDKVANNCGLRDARAVTTFQGAAYWLSMDLRVMRWVPGSLPEPLPCPILQDFVDNYVGTPIMFAVPLREEIWLAYDDGRDAGTGATSRFIAYSIGESIAAQRPVWWRGTLAAQAVLSGSPMSLGASVDPGAFLTGSGQQITIQENGANNTAWHIQTADQYVDEGRRRVMIKRAIHDYEYGVAESLTLYVRDWPGASATTKGPYTPSGNKTDFRASGRVLAAKWSGSSGECRLGKPTFDCVTMGER